jgi:hypothetical protein
MSEVIAHPGPTKLRVQMPPVKRASLDTRTKQELLARELELVRQCDKLFQKVQELELQLREQKELYEANHG